MNTTTHTRPTPNSNTSKDRFSAKDFNLRKLLGCAAMVAVFSIQAQACGCDIFTLADGNTSAQLDLGKQAGMSGWSVDGANQMDQQGFSSTHWGQVSTFNNCGFLLEVSVRGRAARLQTNVHAKQHNAHTRYCFLYPFVQWRDLTPFAFCYDGWQSASVQLPDTASTVSRPCRRPLAHCHRGGPRDDTVGWASPIA